MIRAVRASLAALDTNILKTKMSSPAAGWARTKDQPRAPSGVFHFLTDTVYLLAACFQSRIREKEQPDKKSRLFARVDREKTAGFVFIAILGV
jgi:hypothetical protein